MEENYEGLEDKRQVDDQCSDICGDNLLTYTCEITGALSPNSSDRESLNAMLPSVSFETSDKTKNGADALSQTGNANSDESIAKASADGEGKNAISLGGRDQLRQQAKIYGKVVDKALRQLPEEMQKKFNSLPSNKDGTYSDKQLNFIRSHVGEAAHRAAENYNSLQPMLNFFMQNERLKQAPSEMPKLDIQKYKEQLKDELNKEKQNVTSQLTKLRLQERFDQVKTNMDGSYSPAQLEFLKMHSKEAYMSALNYNELWASISKVHEREKMLSDQVLKSEQAARPEAALLARVLADLANLPKPLQDKFKSLPLFKDGVGYNQEHVNFLRDNLDLASAQRMERYIQLRRQTVLREWNGPN